MGRILARSLFLVLVLSSPLFAVTQLFRSDQIRCQVSLPADWHASPDLLGELNRHVQDQSFQYLAAFTRRNQDPLGYPFISIQIHEARDLQLEELASSIGDLSESKEADIQSGHFSFENLRGGVPAVDQSRGAVLARTETEVPGKGQVEAILAIFVGTEGAIQLNVYSHAGTLTDEDLTGILNGVVFDQEYGFRAENSDLAWLRRLSGATRGGAIAIWAAIGLMVVWKVLRRARGRAKSDEKK